MDRIIIGTWGLCGDFGNVFLGQIEEVLRYAYSTGIKEFDTAPSYGNGFMESCLGKIFYGCKDVIINTKIGNLPFYGKNFEWESINKSIQESLQRLNGLSINILFLHNPREIPYPWTLLKRLKVLKECGIIKAIGLSKAKNYEYNKDFLEQFDVIQDDFNLLYLEPLQYMDKLNPKFMARSVLASGLLTRTEKIFLPPDTRSEWLVGARLESLNRRVRKIKEIAASDDIASIARRFVFSNKAISKIIFGVKNAVQIDDVIADSKKPDLSLEIVAELIDLYNHDFYLKDEGEYKY